MSAQVAATTEETKIVEQLEKVDLAAEPAAEEKPASKMGGLLMKAHKEGELEAKVEAAESATETVEVAPAVEAKEAAVETVAAEPEKKDEPVAAPAVEVSETVAAEPEPKVE